MRHAAIQSTMFMQQMTVSAAKFNPDKSLNYLKET